MDKRTFLKTSGAFVAGSLLAPLACSAPELSPKRTNWAGNVIYSTDRLFVPGNVEELQDVIASNRRIRAMGSRHCFNTLADSTTAQVSLERMSRVVALGDGSVTVEAGMRYGELCPFLHTAGLRVA